MSVLKHFRFAFSLLLLPIFIFSLFTLSPLTHHDWWRVLILGIILHLLVYPSSNAYNSSQDRDYGSIGLIKNPSAPPPYLPMLTFLLDILSMVLALILLPVYCTLLLGIYIVASRLYSFRAVRIKRYPVLGFLLVFVCQGGLVYSMVYSALSNPGVDYSVTYAIISSLFIGSMYPISQIYQHQQDKADGVTTISYLLGIKGTFIFCALLFTSALVMLAFEFARTGRFFELQLIFIFQLPILSYFAYWASKCFKNNLMANFSHTMRFSIISAVCHTLCFTYLVWFSNSN